MNYSPKLLRQETDFFCGAPPPQLKSWERAYIPFQSVDMEMSLLEKMNCKSREIELQISSK